MSDQKPDKPKMPKKAFFLTPSEPNDGEPKNPHDGEIFSQIGNSSRGSEPTTETDTSPVRISGHSLLWCFVSERQAQRKPYRAVQLRNWEKRIWKEREAPGIVPRNVVIVSNPTTLEVWVRARPHRKPEDMIHKSALIALRVAWAFAKWQGITIRLKKTTHPSDIQRGHFVLEEKKLIAPLRPLVGSPASARVGLSMDGSHSYLPELTGPESAEGSIGADWVFLDLRGEIEKLREGQRIIAEGVTMLMRRR